MSRPLWEADSVTAFAARWRERLPFVISNYALETFVTQGRGDDVDDFGALMLSA
jgi:hypothetical protein